MTTKTRENERRDSGIIIILILLLGFICIILASGWALRFTPNWKLDTNMGSNLDPNSDFLTSRPVGFIEPVDPAILTQPAWINLFLTPGVSLATRTPLPTGTTTLIPAKTNTPISTIPATTTLTIAANPTNTLVYFPPTATKTPKPPPPPTNTNTPITSLIAADLQITKTDGVTTYNPGGILTYTVTVINNGPNTVTGAVVTDNKPTQITTWSWACTLQTGGATGCTAISGSSADYADGVNLPVGASIVYTVTANISGTATGSLTNIANVAVPVGYTDPTSGNNSATDIDAQNLPVADLAITKTDPVTTYTPGGTALTYTIVVTNNGPTAVAGAIVTDNKPAQISTWTWVCTSQNGGANGCNGAASSSANFTNTVNLPNVGSNIVYTVTANTSASATGNLVNTANVAVPPLVYTDPTPGNNSATDTDTPTYSTNLQITKNDGSPTYTPGGPITYTIVVNNAGPSNAVGASLTDVIPPEITGTTINCVASGAASCGPNASAGNNLSYTGVNIPVGTATNFVTITVSGTVSSGKIGNLTNTATVTAGSGQTDPAPGNNSQTDVDTPAASSNLAITKTDNATDYAANTTKTYTIVVSNTGPSDAVGATVTDIFSTNNNIASASWTCSVTGAATCTSNGSGDINDTINIAVGATVTYTVTANVVAVPSGSLVNTATVSLPTDPNNSNNSATDTDQLIIANSAGNIGAAPDGSLENIPSGSFLTLQFGSPLVVGSHAGYDLVYYPDPSFQMDMVILQVSDGSNWYTIFYWGNGSPDGNTDINPADCPSETDNCVIMPPPNNPPGISIDLDSVVPNGTYNYIRIFSLPDSGDGVDVDAIAILP